MQNKKGIGLIEEIIALAVLILSISAVSVYFPKTSSPTGMIVKTNLTEENKTIINESITQPVVEKNATSIKEENIPVCKDECSYSGQKGCLGNYTQVCGNYDQDNCLEWKIKEYCEYGCSFGECNPPTCKEGYLEEYRCSGNWKQQKYRLRNCNITWISVKYLNMVVRMENAKQKLL